MERRLLPLAPSRYKRRVSFRALLLDLVTSLPQVRGAIFCDHEGEHVDLAIAQPQPRGCGPLTDFDLKVCGAQVAATWMLLQTTEGAGPPRELSLQCAQGTLICHGVRDGYYVLALLAPGSPRAKAAFTLRRVAAQVERVL